MVMTGVVRSHVGTENVNMALHKKDCGFVECCVIGVFEVWEFGRGSERVFVKIPSKNVVSGNSMISGYARTGDMDRAISLFEEMPERNLASWNALLSGYVNCGSVELARSYFDAMPVRNNVSWITMISGYSKRDFNIQPDEMTLTSVVSACSQLGYLEFGLWIESYTKKNGIQLDDHLANSFIDLYAKCGNIEKAFELFRGLRNKHLVAYSAMISSCGVNGKATEAIELFEEMKKAYLMPGFGEHCFSPVEYTKNVELGEIAARNCFKLQPEKADYSSLLANIYASAEQWNDAEKCFGQRISQVQLGGIMLIKLVFSSSKIKLGPRNGN
uniref:Pentatricopeptide repeat-containing protein n=1 Tax=Cannabis sativa TaxID=3483 RepID=A0A803QAL5_CANSA